MQWVRQHLVWLVIVESLTDLANNHIKTPFAGENVTLDSDFLISVIPYSEVAHHLSGTN